MGQQRFAKAGFMMSSNVELGQEGYLRARQSDEKKIGMSNQDTIASVQHDPSLGSETQKGGPLSLVPPFVEAVD